MATHRNPKGVYTRDTLDFYSNRACYVGAACYTGAQAHYSPQHWWFFNDSNAGQALFVWRVACSFSDAGNAFLQYAASPGGSKVTQGSSAYSNGPSPPGSLWLDIGTIGVVDLQDPLFVSAGTGAIAVFSSPGSTMFPPLQIGPIVLQPGASLFLFGDFYSVTSSVSVVYSFMPGNN